jgi:hypothetical protein
VAGESRAGNPAQPETEWIVQTLRITAFPARGAETPTPPSWKSLLECDPERQVGKPRVGERVEEGPFESGKLQLRVLPDRYHWVYAPKDDAEEVEEAFPNIGPYTSVLLPFVKLMERWVETNPRIVRLAFGAVLLLPAESLEESYRRLDALLPAVKIDPIGTSDVSFTINRPRPSTTGIPNLTINRLMRWSVVAIKKVQLTVTPPGVQVVQDHLDKPDGIACLLDLDLNTAPAHSSVFEKPQLMLVLKELVELGEEIAEKGDLP